MKYSKIGKRVKMFRHRKRLSQAELAEAVDLSPPYISHIERGAKQPSLTVLLRLSSVLDATVDQLLGIYESVDAQMFLPELQELMDDCTPDERCIILDVATAVKEIVREHHGGA